MVTLRNSFKCADTSVSMSSLPPCDHTERDMTFKCFPAWWKKQNSILLKQPTIFDKTHLSEFLDFESCSADDSPCLALMYQHAHFNGEIITALLFILQTKQHTQMNNIFKS